MLKFGSEATVEVDSTSGGSLTDISAYCDEVTLPIERPVAELHRLGGHPVAKVVGSYGAEIRVEGGFDPTVDNILGAWALEANQAARSIAVGPQGNSAGQISYSAEVYLAEYEIDEPGDGIGRWTARFVVDENGLARGTF